jgi:hypothetical protein
MKPRYVPFKYWPATSQEAMREALAIIAVERARRIREQVPSRRCHCQLDPEFVTEDGRCGRCFGRRGER